MPHLSLTHSTHLLGTTVPKYLHFPLIDFCKGPLPGATPGPYSLVHSGVVLPLAREAEHAADDSAVELFPLAVTDLLPFTAVLDLHVALRHGDALTIRRQDGSYTHVLHSDIQVLRTKK